MAGRFIFLVIPPQIYAFFIYVTEIPKKKFSYVMDSINNTILIKYLQPFHNALLLGVRLLAVSHGASEFCPKSPSQENWER